MHVFINGIPREFADDTLNFATLIEREGLVGKRFAIERNGEVVPKSQHASVLIHEGDRLEIIVAVGGG